MGFDLVDLRPLEAFNMDHNSEDWMRSVNIMGLVGTIHAILGVMAVVRAKPKTMMTIDVLMVMVECRLSRIKD